ncbi:ABC transporter permease [Lactococcus nasutitermitis]|uniref:ABC transporter permease n=1 Tax=Lactococcus nasutitermitis TaxID=1652957 RepID=A0ABV9JCN2_9LACT|nr:ABC transporter permease [Lactococcus nasutitermitis]
MNAKNIFRMEFYRNFRDKAWLIVTACLFGTTLLTAILGLIAIRQFKYEQFTTGVTLLDVITLTLLFFVLVGMWAFSIIYPFHLLSVDYSNKALGLMVASGVNRVTYYFIKIITTILSTLLAWVVILFIPVVLYLGIYSKQFTEFATGFSHAFTLTTAWGALLNGLFGVFASIAILFFTVILTRGKFWGIFVYFGFTLVLGIVANSFSASMALASGSSSNDVQGIVNYIGLAFSIFKLVLFGLLGIFMIRNQDL